MEFPFWIETRKLEQEGEDGEKRSRGFLLSKTPESRELYKQTRTLLSKERKREEMALTNFVVTVAAVGAVILLARTDIRKSAALFRRNVRHIRNWLEEESTAASKSAEKVKPKELESQANKKDSRKDEKD